MDKKFPLIILFLLSFFMIIGMTLAEEATNGWVYFGYPKEMKNGEESVFAIYITVSRETPPSDLYQEYKNFEWEKEPHAINISTNVELTPIGSTKLFLITPGQSLSGKLGRDNKLNNSWYIDALDEGEGHLGLHYVSERLNGVNIIAKNTINIQFDLSKFIKDNWQTILQLMTTLGIGGIFGTVLTLLRRRGFMKGKDKERMDEGENSG